MSACCDPDIHCNDTPITVAPVLDQFTAPAPASPFSYNIAFFAPIGQSFVPRLKALDFVSVYFDDASCSGTGGPGGDLRVRIKKTSITSGAIIGESNTIHFDNCFVGLRQFQFPSYVPLTPGQTYFIEVVYVSGNTSAVFLDLNSSFYPAGSFYLSGAETPGDLVFQEGIFYSLPTSQCDCVDHLGQLLSPSGKPFKNLRECLQFVKGQD